MWALTDWGRRSNEAAVCNARDAATDLARRRVEATEVEIFLSELAGAPVAQEPAQHLA